MAETVYILCALTSMACTFLLWRGYRRSRSRLLLWSSLCFAALAANNILLFVDLVLLPNTDLLMLRTVVALVGLLVLLFGLIWDAG
jgi:drug/metabolite transporter superfamily protein YnfA